MHECSRAREFQHAIIIHASKMRQENFILTISDQNMKSYGPKILDFLCSIGNETFCEISVNSEMKFSIYIFLNIFLHFLLLELFAMLPSSVFIKGWITTERLKMTEKDGKVLNHIFSTFQCQNKPIVSTAKIFWQMKVEIFTDSFFFL